MRWILDRGVDAVWAHELELIRTFVNYVETNREDLPGLSFYGPRGVEHRCGVFSVRIDHENEHLQPQALADELENRFGILTRAGIHCAPLAHQTIGTHALGGTTRLSFGPFLTPADVSYACDALAQLCRERAAVPA